MFEPVTKPRDIFPARVGMNPFLAGWGRRRLDFPRASGDEPEGEALMKQEDEFSPREWG